MEILHLTPKDYQTSHWSGGTTTQLLILPQGADYASRQFSLRISSATVELPESDFTPLPGVMRYITPLTGGFTLTHPGSAPVVMAPLDQPYRFSGETPTHCVGVATDFNLMLKGIPGEMTVCSGTIALRPGINSFYATAAATVAVEGKRFPLAAGDLLVIHTQLPGNIDLGNVPVIVCWAEV
jgi:environmental stress-induced protein Ves